MFILLSASLAYAEDMRFVQISDARYNFNSKDSYLSKVISEINKQKKVDFVVFTGDNIDTPSKDNLENFLKEAKKLNCPFYIVLGEHDVNRHKDLSKVQYFNIVKKYNKKSKQKEPNFVFVKNDIVFILPDGSKEVIPSTNGFYKAEVLNWLEDTLALYPDKKIIIIQHFPIVPPSNKESYYTFKPEKYLSILEQNKNIKVVISGHFGVNSEKNVNGVIHVATSGLPYYRIIDIMDYETNSPTIWTVLKSVK